MFASRLGKILRNRRGSESRASVSRGVVRPDLPPELFGEPSERGNFCPGVVEVVARAGQFRCDRLDEAVVRITGDQARPDRPQMLCVK